MTAQVVEVERERWVLTSSIHLGYVKDTFGAGTVLEYEPETRTLLIEGRRCDLAKDLDVLKKINKMRPDNPIIVPYDDEAIREAELKNALAEQRRVQIPEKKRPPRLEVVQSDQDMMPEPIDIKHTQMSKIKNGQIIQERVDKKARSNEPMEVIRGDETAEERIARLSTTIPKMEVVRDDSLGAGSSSKRPSLNAGAVVHRSHVEIERIRQENLAKVQAKAVETVTEESVEDILPIELDEDFDLTEAEEITSTDMFAELEAAAEKVIRIPVTPENLMRGTAG